jgi:hypothetical protein
MDVAERGVELVHELHRWAAQGGRRGTDEAKAERRDFELRFHIFTARLLLVDMATEAVAMNSFWNEAAKSAEPGASAGPALIRKYLEVLRAFNAAVAA